MSPDANATSISFGVTNMEHHVLKNWTDIATYSGKQKAVLNPDAVLIFDADLNTIVWSNVSGADLFGGCPIETFIGQSFAPSHPFIRQLDAATRQIDNKPITRAFRVVSDDGGHLLQCVVERVKIADDNTQQGICVTCQNKKFADIDEGELAQNLLDGLGAARGAAVLDEYGLPIAANTPWGEADFDIDDVENALSEDETQSPRSTVSMKTEFGNEVALDIMALGDSPKRFLCFIGDTIDIASLPVSSAGETIDEAFDELEKPNDIDTVSPLPLLDDFANSNPLAKNDQDSLPSLLDEEKVEADIGTSSKVDGDQVDNTDAQKIADEIVEPVSTKRPFRFKNSASQVRFSWSTNTEQEFTFVSDEFAEAVGPNAADIVGRNWQDVARVFGFDQTGEIHSLLQNQDTWSGKCVAWPIQGTDLVAPVDLAALPAFSSGRNFQGFRGFGIVRLIDAIVDPDETGMALSETEIGLDDEVSFHIKADVESEEPGVPALDEDSSSAIASNVVSLVGIRDAKDEASSDEKTTHEEDLDALEREFSKDAEDATPDNLSKENSETISLSDGENRAFDEIGRKLSTPDEYSIDLERDLESQFELSKSDPFVPQEQGDIEYDGIDVGIIEALPFPVLIFRDSAPLYANPEFFTLTGHRDLAGFNEAGGLETLFGERDEFAGDALVNLNASDGSGVKVRAIIKSVPWDSHEAMMVTFRQPKHKQHTNSEKIALDMMRVSELENILDTATDGILIIDEKGIVQSVNQSAEALFGKPHDVIENGTIYEQFATESHASIREYLDALSQPGVKSILNDGREVIGIEENGGLIPLFITIGKVGRTGKLCAVLRDITQWKRASEELVAAKKEAENASDQKTDFLARISHEIRTPLNAIIGFSDVMIDERFGPIDNKRYREYLRDINRSGVHVLELINDLLDISKIEAGKMELSFESVDLNRIVSETVALLQPQANGEQVLIRTSLSRAVPNVVADARSIRQIVLNLVSNAIKFTQANGQVVVSTVYEGNGEVALRIRDTGRGMSEEEITKAMQPFQQVNAINDRREDGTGLGLPLTKALVEANKAYFDIESERDEGTIVHIQFPSQRVLAD